MRKKRIPQQEITVLAMAGERGTGDRDTRNESGDCSDYQSNNESAYGRIVCRP
jgi:hypothetical protein